MSGLITKRLLEAYHQMASPTLFFSGMFQSPPRNFHDSEEVEIDIIRDDEDVSIVVQDLSAGSRMNSADLYTSKGFKPPVHDESFPINSFDLLKRMPGNDPFQSPKFRGSLISKMMTGMVGIERKIRRAMELQASQVLQSGIVTLRDKNGVALYTLDFKPKASHFPVVATAWDDPASTKVNDISALAEEIRNDGLIDPDELHMGINAFEEFIKDPKIIERFDTRRVDLGNLVSMSRLGNGGSYRGVVTIGNYKYDVYTYGGRYKDPQTGVKIQYLDPGKVIVRASSGRLDATFGAIPNIGKMLGVTGGSLLPELPGRMSNGAGGMDLFTNVWLSPDGKQLFGGVGARPLFIPTAIDTFGCITTGV